MSNRPEIHLINPLWDSAGGSEWRTVELYRELASHAEVLLWTESDPDPLFAAALPVRRIDRSGGHYPRGGTLAFVGVYQLPGDWLSEVHPRRVVVIYNTRQPRQLVRFTRRLFAQAIERVEIVYASELLRQQTKLAGVVQPSLIDIERFQPRGHDLLPRSQRFVVGRFSRDDLRKHHPDDVAVYQRLVEAGCGVRVMGGSCLAPAGPNHRGIELLPAKAEPPESFLRSIDCFFYRTAETCWETFGRVIHEAMACGLPVVCHGRGGYSTSIHHGQNGFLFETSDEALSIIRRLQDEPSLRTSIGHAARATIESMYSPAERAKVIQYYLL